MGSEAGKQRPKRNEEDAEVAQRSRGKARPDGLGAVGPCLIHYFKDNRLKRVEMPVIFWG